MTNSLTARNFIEFEAARKPGRSSDANNAKNSVLAELAIHAVPRVRELAKRTLRFAMEDIFRRHLFVTDSGEWPEDAEYMLWRAMLNGPDTITKEEVEEVDELFVEAGGWWSTSHGEVVFFENLAWRARYEEWVRSVTRKL